MSPIIPVCAGLYPARSHRKTLAMPDPHDTRPFSKRWRIEESGESFQIVDSVGRHLAYVYFEDERTRRYFTKRLSKDDARRMAQQILRLPELVRIARGIEPGEA